MNSVIAIVLGGGAGTRLRPLTNTRSKPALPFLGKYRLIDIPISNCLNAGINRIFVLTQYNSASLNNYISTTYRFNDFNSGFVSVIAAEQTPASHDWFKGTADAVRQMLNHLKRYAYSHVLVLSGDQIYQTDFENMLRSHIHQKVDISVATVPVIAQEATRLGIMKVDEHHNIVHFHEKPDAKELPYLAAPKPGKLNHTADTFMASAGIYLFNRHVLDNMLIYNPQFTDFGREVIPDGIDKYTLHSYLLDGYWSDLGTIKEYHRANLLLAQQESPFQFYNTFSRIYTESQILPPARIYNTRIHEAVIGEGSQIYNSEIDHAVLGQRSYVGPHSSLRNVVMMGATYYEGDQAINTAALLGPARPGIGSNCIIEDAIIDQNACIGDHCIIKNDTGVQEAEGENFFIRDGIIVIPQDAEIPARTRIGCSFNDRKKPASHEQSGWLMPEINLKKFRDVS